MADVKTEYYEDKKGEWRWRKTHKNGEIIGASSEGYVNKKDCQANANRGSKAGDRWEFYKDKKGEHRWRCFASNGKQVGRATPATSTPGRTRSRLRSLVEGAFLFGAQASTW